MHLLGLDKEVEARLGELKRQVVQRDIKELLREAEEHLKVAREAHRKNGLTNYPMARRIYEIFRELEPESGGWDEDSVEWFKAVVMYFIVSEDNENDLESPIGFDDDAEALNAFLDQVGRGQLRINLEDY